MGDKDDLKFRFDQLVDIQNAMYPDTQHARMCQLTTDTAALLIGHNHALGVHTVTVEGTHLIVTMMNGEVFHATFQRKNPDYPRR